MSKDEALYSAADDHSKILEKSLYLILLELQEYRSALRWYAQHDNWMQVSEGAVARMLFVSGAKRLPIDGYAVAENILAKYPYKETPW